MLPREDRIGQLRERIEATKKLLTLTDHPQWASFAALVEAEAERECPPCAGFGSADLGVHLASKYVYATGLRRAVQLVEAQRALLKADTEELTALERGDAGDAGDDWSIESGVD